MRNILSLALLFLTIITGTVFPKKNIQFKGYMELGKNQVSITKDNFSKACKSYRTKPLTKNIRVLALVDSSFDPGILTEYGWKYRSKVINNIVELDGPAETACYLTAIDGLSYVKMPSRVFSCMDSARKITHVDEVHGNVLSNLPKSYDGNGVLVGIMETEFDTHHPAFLDSLGSTRFLSIWDQNDTTGPSNRFGYGTIKNHDQIDADPQFALYGNATHGTWVSGFAAGSVVKSNPYYGPAPKSSLIGLKYSGLDNDLIDGIKWIFSIADSLNMPCVINMSIGSQSGPHDGTSLIDRSIDDLSGKGRIIVGAAGNDRDKKPHIKFTLNKNETKSTWITPAQWYSGDALSQSASAIEMWGTSGVYFSATFLVLDKSTMNYYQLKPVINTSTNTNYLDTLYYTDSANNKIDTLIFQVVSTRRSLLNNKVHVEAFLSGTNPDHYLGVKVLNPNSSTDTINAWNLFKKSFESFSQNGFFDGDSEMSINEVGATAKRNITAGAYNSKLRIELWNGTIHESDNFTHNMTMYSSAGPTADGRIKPDICAPGSEIVGPLSRVSTEAEDKDVVLWPDTTTRYGRYSFTGGTSMAAPVVTGIVALMLQADPDLTPEEVKQIIQETALTDEFTTGTLNNLWGAGKINAYGAIQKILGITKNKITSNADDFTHKFKFLPNSIKISGDLSNDIPCVAAWYSISGKLICKQNVGRDQIVYYPKSAGSQLYVLKLKMLDATKTIYLKK